MVRIRFTKSIEPGSSSGGREEGGREGVKTDSAGQAPFPHPDFFFCLFVSLFVCFFVRLAVLTL